MHPEQQQEINNAQADAEQQRAMHDAGRFDEVNPYTRLADAVRAWHKQIDHDAANPVYPNWDNEKRATVRRNLGGAVRAAMKEIDDAK